MLHAHNNLRRIQGEPVLHQVRPRALPWENYVTLTLVPHIWTALGDVSQVAICRRSSSTSRCSTRRHWIGPGLRPNRGTLSGLSWSPSANSRAVSPPPTWWPWERQVCCPNPRRLRHDETTKMLDLGNAHRKNAALLAGTRRRGVSRMIDERGRTAAVEYSSAFVILVDGYITQGNLTALQSLRSIYTAATRRPLVSNRQDNLDLMSIFETRLALLDEAITAVSLAALKRHLAKNDEMCG